eukprot:GHVS01047405.1.p1 GENE.GHVS01047405.1~~GHVS01047405.1.p1  ORF type:complete len:155 (+),score=19.69 GHVS01047405.1:477-941(+)
MNEAGATALNVVKERYSIVSRIGITRAKNKVSVDRIVACYPFLLASFMASGGGSAGVAVPDGFPRYLCFYAAPSLFPADQYNDLMPKWKIWEKSFSEKESKMEKKKKEESSDDGEIAYASPAVPMGERAGKLARLEECFAGVGSLHHSILHGRG